MDDIPPIKRYGRGDRLYIQAQRIWVIIIAFVMRRRPGDRETMTYGDVAEAMGLDRRAGHTLGRQLGIIAQYCILNDLPALNAVVVTEKGFPGDEVLVREDRTIPEEQAAVLGQDWFALRVPTTGTLRKVREKYFAA